MTARARSRPWLELVRVFLIPSSLADSVAGFFVATTVAGRETEAGPLAAAAGASMALYAFGMVTNDLLGVEKDLQHAPDRPIPSGRVRRKEAAGLAVSLALLALFLAGLAGGPCTALAVVLLALAYNAGGQHVPVAGNLLMGACRAGNYLLGAAAALGEWSVYQSPLLLAAAAAPGVYIAGVTAVSRLEEREHRPSRFHLIATPLIAVPLLLAALQPASSGGWINAVLLLWLLIAAQRQAVSRPHRDGPASFYVRRALGGIYLVDAGTVWAFARPSITALLAALSLYLLAVAGWLLRWWWLRRGGLDT